MLGGGGGVGEGKDQDISNQRGLMSVRRGIEKFNHEHDRRTKMCKFLKWFYF